MLSRAWRCSVVLCFPLALAGLPLCACLLSGCGRGAHAESAPKAKPPEPEALQAAVLMVEPTTWPATVRTQGSLIADEVTIVGAKVAGRVNAVNFDLGDAVK